MVRIFASKSMAARNEFHSIGWEPAGVVLQKGQMSLQMRPSGLFSQMHTKRSFLAVVGASWHSACPAQITVPEQSTQAASHEVGTGKAGRSRPCRGTVQRPTTSTGSHHRSRKCRLRARRSRIRISWTSPHAAPASPISTRCFILRIRTIWRWWREQISAPAIAGSFLGDKQMNFPNDAEHHTIADRLIAAGLDFKQYAEELPGGTCPWNVSGVHVAEQPGQLCSPPRAVSQLPRGAGEVVRSRDPRSTPARPIISSSGCEERSGCLFALHSEHEPRRARHQRPGRRRVGAEIPR